MTCPITQSSVTPTCSLPDPKSELETLKKALAHAHARISLYESRFGPISSLEPSNEANEQEDGTLAPAEPRQLPPEIWVVVGKFLPSMSKDLLHLMKTCRKAYELLMPRFVEEFDSSRFIYEEPGGGQATDAFFGQFVDGPSGEDKFKHVKHLRVASRYIIYQGLVRMCVNLQSVDFQVECDASYLKYLLLASLLTKLTLSLSGTPSGSSTDLGLKLPLLQELVLDIYRPEFCATVPHLFDAAPNLGTVAFGFYSPSLLNRDWSSLAQSLPDRFVKMIKSLRILCLNGRGVSSFLEALVARKTGLEQLLRPRTIEFVCDPGDSQNQLFVNLLEGINQSNLRELRFNRLSTVFLADGAILDFEELYAKDIELTAEKEGKLGLVSWNMQDMRKVSIGSVRRMPKKAKYDYDLIVPWRHELQFWKRRVGKEAAKRWKLDDNDDFFDEWGSEDEEANGSEDEEDEEDSEGEN